MKNTTIIEEFKKLIEQINYDIDNEIDIKKRTVNMFRLKQINNALNIIKNQKDEIKNGKQLEDIKGIGKGIIRRIDEIIKTGKLSEITINQENINEKQYIENLKEVYGIGNTKASELVHSYNIKTVKELKKAHSEGKINLNDNAILGLKYYGVYKPQIPRKEMKKMDKYIKKLASKIDENLKIEICGSYRREKKFSNDIDCMMTHENIVTIDDLENESNYLQQFIEFAKEKSFIVDSITGDDVETKFMGFCQYSEDLPIRRIDIRYMPYNSYYAALLYFTGSGQFNRNMRQIAKKMGYKLNEYGLYKKTKKGLKKIKINSEEDIFKKLDMEYVEPKERI